MRISKAIGTLGFHLETKKMYYIFLVWPPILWFKPPVFTFSKGKISIPFFTLMWSRHS